MQQLGDPANTHIHTHMHTTTNTSHHIATKPRAGAIFAWYTPCTECFCEACALGNERLSTGSALRCVCVALSLLITLLHTESASRHKIVSASGGGACCAVSMRDLVAQKSVSGEYMPPFCLKTQSQTHPHLPAAPSSPGLPLVAALSVPSCSCPFAASVYTLVSFASSPRRT